MICRNPVRSCEKTDTESKKTKSIQYTAKKSKTGTAINKRNAQTVKQWINRYSRIKHSRSIRMSRSTLGPYATGEDDPPKSSIQSY
jgi:hypothetical protein